MIEIKNISMSYGVDYILKDLTYKFKTGLVYGLIGKNGAGKTTLLKIIMRLIRENQGSVFIDGKCVDNVDFLKVPAIFIGDSPIFYSDLTVREQLLLVCNSQRIEKKEAISRIDILLDELKLTKYKNNFPNTLSKGTLQRLNIALGMIRNESIILMDEPFNALDPVQVSAVETLVLKSKEKGKTLLISSHDIDSLRSICDVYLILRNGQLLEYMPNELTKENIAQIIGDSYGD
ncbi:ABC transporter ATP-binding protein [Thermoanaerobacterium thermosaccharolyticum]|uniref:ABC transporter ATP-binding protein n=1 Tax=Thermoanaerobacterium thermosaccharolyticum TaxID=1517 RepID=UPI003D26B245